MKNEYKKEGIQAIKAIDKELERLHFVLNANSTAEANGIIFSSIMKLEKTLDEIARRWNGLEY